MTIFQPRRRHFNIQALSAILSDRSRIIQGPNVERKPLQVYKFTFDRVHVEENDTTGEYREYSFQIATIMIYGSNNHIKAFCVFFNSKKSRFQKIEHERGKMELEGGQFLNQQQQFLNASKQLKNM